MSLERVLEQRNFNKRTNILVFSQGVMLVEAQITPENGVRD